MFIHKSILFVVGLSLAACTDTSIHTSTLDATVSNAKLSVHIVQTDGGG